MYIPNEEEYLRNGGVDYSMPGVLRLPRPVEERESPPTPPTGGRDERGDLVEFMTARDEHEGERPPPHLHGPPPHLHGPPPKAGDVMMHMPGAFTPAMRPPEPDGPPPKVHGDASLVRKSAPSKPAGVIPKASGNSDAYGRGMGSGKGKGVGKVIGKPPTDVTRMERRGYEDVSD